MASVLLVLLDLVATLAVSAGASRPDPEPQPQLQQPSYPSSSSSCNKLGFGALSCALAQGALDQVRDKCCNDLGKCGKFICPAVRQVADSIPFLQGMCKGYNACSAEKWSGEASKEDCRANECKAAVEALKEYMG